MAHFAGANTLNFGGDTPTGNFVPEIYSKKVLQFFRRKSIVEGITNSDYFGEISAYGDTVKIIKEPIITVTPHLRDDIVTAQALEDDQLILVLDKANRFSFRVDDIEKKISHMNWMSLATDSAAYSLKQAYDTEVLNYMSTQALAANVVGTALAPVNTSVADDLLDMMSHLSTKLTLQDVPEENRWLVLSPEAMEVLAKAESKLLNADFNGGVADLRNGLVSTGKLRGFNIHMTNNAPKDAEGNFVLMAGHMSAVATATAITNTETLRDNNRFADIVRGMHVYGRQVIRPESLAIAHVAYS
jgi:hypothetical protein